ncbi:MAG: tRNA (adenosine(37)-N6)-dimethylallyltransferase MiaA [Patescibacteria group bacterium]|nr:tRNA (adenosine(37)-N6)-dimethylallyltransferase MiaA [Patescibacteria group bacterium]
MKITHPNQLNIVAIVGPTASGKSELAVKLAEEFNGEIVSADSRQVYKGLNIGSGKITKKEMSGIPHYLLDVASPKRTFTAAEYQKLGKEAIEKILAKGKLPIICGGTGFYIDALIHGYKLPSVKPNQKLRRELEKQSAEKLFSKLQLLDPERAITIDKYNKRRLIRALEIVIETGKPVRPLEQEKKTSYRVLKIGIRLPPEELKSRIKKRVEKRIREGMIKEVENLHKRGVSWRRLDELGLEYRFISRYLRGLITKKEMIQILEKEIRQYAKRQVSWFKRNKEIHWLKTAKEAEKLVKKFILRAS